AATIGEAGTEGVDKDLLFAAWRSALEATARQNPLVIIFEDLHWSSDSLLDLAEFVMQPRGDAAVLMIVLARPELLDRRPNWGGGRLNHLAIALEPLASNTSPTSCVISWTPTSPTSSSSSPNAPRAILSTRASWFAR